MSKSISECLDEIFNIPKDGSNIKEEADESQETSYADVISVNESETFEEKAKKLTNNLSKDAPPVDVIYVDKEEMSNEQEKIAEKQKERSTEEDKLEKILTNSVRSQQSISMEVLPVVQKSTLDNQATKLEEDDGDTTPERTDVNQQNTTPIHETHLPNENGWLLTSPYPMLNNFYAQKAFLITSITKTGKQLPIPKLLEELQKSYVNTSVEMSDLHGMYNKLTDIQNFLDRVVQIKILATAQCSATKRSVELLRGLLAKVCYEKPAARQDGVNYDHLRDIEMYACEIESLEQAAKDIYHNLLEAKEILSRKISVSIELFKQQTSTDAMDKSMSNLPTTVKKAIHDVEKNNTIKNNHGFDSLDVQEVVKAKTVVEKMPIKKSGQIDWFD
jgi:hypothetical protein